jgi:hypothetical protein
MIFDNKSPQSMTSAELEEAILRHREHTKALLAEVRNRRAELSKPAPVNKAEKPSDKSIPKALRFIS